MKATVCSLLTLLVATPSLDAQLDLSWQGGVLNNGLVFELEGDTAQLYVLLISLKEGPTPLALLDPNDPRSLGVGLDLKNLARSGFLRAQSFSASEVFTLPHAPGLQGLPLYAQAMTLPGSQYFVDEVSKRSSFVFALPDSSHLTLSPQQVSRRHASATALGNGRVLIAGGRSLDGALNDFEWFNENTQTFVAGGQLTGPRSHHSSHLLANGSVLLVGGLTSNGNALATAVLVGPDGAVSQAGSLSSVRVHHATTMLHDGRVLVVGGSKQSNAEGALGLPESLFASASKAIEIYDPLTNSWSSGATLPSALTGASAVLLHDGRVLIAGGVHFDAGNEASTHQCFLYDPQNNSLEPTTNLPTPRAFAAATPTLDGRALLVGGARLYPSSGQVIGEQAALIYDISQGAQASSGSWSVGPLGTSVVIDGEIECLPRRPTGPFGTGNPIPPIYFASGGFEDADMLGKGSPNNAVMQIDAKLETASSPGNLITPRLGVALAPLTNGDRVLVIGAAQGQLSDSSAEVHITSP